MKFLLSLYYYDTYIFKNKQVCRSHTESRIIHEIFEMVKLKTRLQILWILGIDKIFHYFLSFSLHKMYETVVKHITSINEVS